VIAGSGVAVSDLAGGAEAQRLDGVTGPVIAHDTGAAVVIGRHGDVDPVPAHRVDHIGNLQALVSLGCDRVLALASTGSLRADWPVGTVVMPDDVFAPWVTPSVFDDARGHTVPGFDEPWRRRVVEVWRASTGTPATDGGVYVQTIGPRFETAAEIRFFATVGDLVGMTLAAECTLAKEFGLAYAAVCMVDNMANGIGDVTLTRELFESGVARNRERFVDDVRGVIPRLLEDA
jgi:5'-methylthioadenosine phosphorylase